jgi:uncharacterized protein DUF4258
VSEPRVRFSEHAIDRMLEWGLDVEDVEAALSGGETIEEYEDGSRLVLGRAGIRPLHVVAAEQEAGGLCTVVTVYEPDPARWDPTFRQRRTR